MIKACYLVQIWDFWELMMLILLLLHRSELEQGINRTVWTKINHQALKSGLWFTLHNAWLSFGITWVLNYSLCQQCHCMIMLCYTAKCIELAGMRRVASHVLMTITRWPVRRTALDHDNLKLTDQCLWNHVSLNQFFICDPGDCFSGPDSNDQNWK